MRVLVRHGHFAFYPTKREDALHFQRLFKLALVREGDFYTFEGLQGLPRWSQVGRLFGTLPATATYEGRGPWDVMAANDWVYSLGTGLLIPTATVSETVEITQSRDFAIAGKPLIQPGAVLTGDANVLLGYEGFLDLDRQRLYLGSLETLL